MMKYFIFLIFIASSAANASVDCDQIATRLIQSQSFEDTKFNHKSVAKLCMDGVGYAKEGVSQKAINKAIKEVNDKDERVAILRRSSFSQGYYGTLRDMGYTYFDFESQEYINKDEVDKRDKKLSTCVDIANKMTSEGIANGTIPFTSSMDDNTSFQSAFFQEYFQKCMINSKN